MACARPRCSAKPGGSARSGWCSAWSRRRTTTRALRASTWWRRRSVTSSEVSRGAASAAVTKVLQELVEEGPEIGLQVAAYLDGRLVVDSWAGVADEASGRPVDGDSLFMLSSTTKGVTATCMAVLADRGKLDYDRTVASYWP